MNRIILLLSFFVIAGNSFAQVSFSIKEQFVEKGKPICSEITVANFAEILTAQFTVVWDPSIIQFDSVSSMKLAGLSKNNFGTSKVNQGILSFSWFDGLAVGKSLNDGEILFSVCFSTIGQPNDKSPLEISDKPIKVEVTDINSDGENIGAVITNGSVTIQENGGSMFFENLSIEPGTSGCTMLSTIGIDQINKLSGTIVWDPGIAVFDSICCLHPQLNQQYYNTLLSVNGMVLMNYNTLVPIDTKSTHVLAGLCFTAKGAPESFTNLALDGSYFQLDIKDGNNKIIKAIDGKISIDLMTFKVILPDKVAKLNQTIEVPIMTGISGYLQSFSGSLSFPSEELIYSDVYESKIPGFVFEQVAINNGIATLGWNWNAANNPFFISSMDTLASIQLTVKGNPGVKYYMKLNNEKFPLKAQITVGKTYNLNVKNDSASIYVLPDSTKISIDNQTGDQYDILCLPIKVSNFQDIAYFKTVFLTDNKMLQPTEVNNKLIPSVPAPLFSVLADKIIVEWGSTNNKYALNLAEGSEIFEVCYQLFGAEGTKTEVILDTSSNYLLGEIKSKAFPLQTSKGIISIGSNNLIINSSVSHNHCKSDSNGEITLNCSGGKYPLQFVWSNGSQSQNLSNLKNGLYDVTISDSGSPVIQKILSFEIKYLNEEPVFSKILDQNIDCPGQTVIISADNTELFYTWHSLGFLNNGTTSIELSQAGVYYVEGTDLTTSCSKKDTFYIEPAPYLEPAFVTESFLSVCDFALLSASQSAGISGKWIGQTGTILYPSESETQVNDLKEGLQSFIWTVSTSSCENYSSDTVWVFKRTLVKANDDVVSKVEKNYNVLANDALNPGLVVFQVIDKIPQGISIDSFGNLKLASGFQYWKLSIRYKICDPMCSDFCSEGLISFEETDDSTATDPEISKHLQPNAISPNEDGINDYLVFDDLELQQYPAPHLMVFDRLGNIIFEDKDYKNNWNGRTQSGRELPVDTYYYVLYLDLYSGKYLKGPITILK